MYEQLQEDLIFVMLYAIAMTMALMASAYLLFRRGNAFAEDIIPPLRLRRWVAVFFGIMAAGHLWYLPGILMAEGDAATLWMLIGGLLDYLLTLPVVLIVMLCMLQDRRRPLWPVWLAMVPPVIMMGVNIANRSDALLPWIQGYILLAVIGFTVYMVREVRQYGRWLRDNYADLEHKGQHHLRVHHPAVRHPARGLSAVACGDAAGSKSSHFIGEYRRRRRYTHRR